jgi:hypothetical protein
MYLFCINDRLFGCRHRKKLGTGRHLTDYDLLGGREGRGSAGERRQRISWREGAEDQLAREGRGSAGERAEDQLAREGRGSAGERRQRISWRGRAEDQLERGQRISWREGRGSAGEGGQTISWREGAEDQLAREGRESAGERAEDQLAASSFSFSSSLSPSTSSTSSPSSSSCINSHYYSRCCESGAFMTPGSGIGKQSRSGIFPRS